MPIMTGQQRCVSALLSAFSEVFPKSSLRAETPSACAEPSAKLSSVKRDNGKRCLVIGASGQVGTQLVEWLESRSPGQVLPTSSKGRRGFLQLDLASKQSVAAAVHELDSVDLGAIYCLGSMTNVDACESEPQLAMRANADGPAVLAGYAQQRGLPFVYVSTEYVFAGSREAPGPYREDSRPEPLSQYGRSKLAGERAVLAAHPGALVLRTTVVYGVDLREKNYLYAVLRNLEAGRTLRVPQDQISTPTYNRDLARACVGLAEAGASGIWHVCGPERMDRLAFAQQVAAHFGLDASLLQGVTTAALGQVAPRPLAAGLDCSALTSVYPQFAMRTLKEALADCSARMAELPSAHAT